MIQLKRLEIWTLSQLPQKMMQLRLFDDTINPYGKIRQKRIKRF
mgnify:CR=1 FL=1